MTSLFGVLQQGLQFVAHRLGYQITKFPSKESYDAYLRVMLLALAIDCVIDVGAHFGEFYTALRKNGFKGRIVSFEPVPTSFDRLCRTTAGDTNWRGYNVALGTEHGTQDINLPDSTGFASFLRPNEYCQERFPHARWSGRTVSVQVERLDDIYKEATTGLDHPRIFLKMDTQGWDPSVVAGARQSLSNVVALQSEVSVIPIYDGMRSIEQSIVCYKELGFELAQLFPVTFDAAGVWVIEYDCIMCRAAAAPATPVRPA